MKLTKGLPGLSSGSVPGGSGRPEAEGEAVGSADAVVVGAGGASPTGTSDGAAVSVGVGGAGSSSIEGGRQGVTREEDLEFYRRRPPPTLLFRFVEAVPHVSVEGASGRCDQSPSSAAGEEDGQQLQLGPIRSPGR